MITEAEHQLIRNTRDRADAYLLGGSGADGGSKAAAAAAAVTAAANGPVKPAAAAGGGVKGGVVGSKAVSISVSVGGVAAAAGGADVRAENVDMAMVVSGEDAVKVGGGCQMLGE